ncbi:MAG: dihydrodipicolinate synthase family protein [Acidaminococcaceae bacterium]|nr:dihydrodipicolinate synthase family protein [Acidaminococcaceae bacterium]MBQ9256958.1 dihydrodipicolinate synthase family protein [Acidaminococcaceae bacterium]MBR1662283.1 dihydrodipicolinate synthase family protein [Acidaminococcaceae bacterium]MBR2182556.1 dihydrodipicolinate synthase family protein [Acidaminococcaceae bacterium]
MAINLSGSWVAMPIPFDKKGTIDFDGFKTLIDRQIIYGTSQLFVLGSAAEVSLLTSDEKKEIVRQTIRIVNHRIPVFFSAASNTTDGEIEMAKFAEAQGADGVIFTIPPYVLIPQEDAFRHLDTVMGATSLPCGIYNNPARLGVQVEPETIKRLSDRHENFVVDKEATGSVYQLVQVQRLTRGKVKIMCCDSPWYAIALPTLAVGGTGFANIGGNIIPEEAARYSRPWTSIEIVNESREEYFKYFPLLQELYEVSNPVVIKAALNLLGLPGGHVRRPYQDYDGEGLKRLEKVMTELGIFEKYAVR